MAVSSIWRKTGCYPWSSRRPVQRPTGPNSAVPGPAPDSDLSVAVRRRRTRAGGVRRLQAHAARHRASHQSPVPIRGTQTHTVSSSPTQEPRFAAYFAVGKPQRSTAGFSRPTNRDATTSKTSVALAPIVTSVPAGFPFGLASPLE